MSNEGGSTMIAAMALINEASRLLEAAGLELHAAIVPAGSPPPWPVPPED